MVAVEVEEEADKEEEEEEVEEEEEEEEDEAPRTISEAFANPPGDLMVGEGGRERGRW